MTVPLTYSNYSTLRSCGRRFKLQCIDLVPQPRAVALEFGSAMHAGLHDVLITKDVVSAHDVFEAFWNSPAIIGLDWAGERHSHGALEAMGLTFISNFHRRYGKDMTFLTGEQRLYAQYVWQEGTPEEDGIQFNFAGANIEGTPDAMVEWNGKNVLLDFKTAAYNYLGEKLDTSLQLNLYAWLIEQNHKHGLLVNELAYVVFVKGTGSIQTLRTIPYDEKKALALINDMVTYWHRNNSNFEKNPNACLMGKYICPYFGKCWKEKNE